ncbi:MAG: RodZ domain-containing protein [Pseudomonas sp.]|uniref:RodZ domain-containing protein n=1 Tax=Pseudomonas sp. TaxID=306 RepID=UPI00339942B1
MKAAHPEAVATTRINPGETLRVAREAKHRSVAEVATQLNLTPQRLAQLEAGEFDKLPGHTFARGYIRAYAKLLGMDQNRLVVEFDQFTGTDAAGSSVHSLGRIEEPVRLSQGILGVVSFVLLLLLGGGAFYWWQGQSDRSNPDRGSIGLEHVEVESADGTTQIHPLDEPEDQAVAQAQVSQELPLDEVASELAAAPEPSAPPVSPTPQPAEPVAPTMPNDPVAVAPAPTTTPTAPAAVEPSVALPVVPVAGEGVVQLQFTADCWTQLKDASGKVLLSALKRSGERLEFRGKAPLELRLGFARGVQVSYNGQPVDVTPFTTGETARLKLGQ